MSATANAMSGAPCWIELHSTDIERSREFYGSLFGWSPGESSAEFGGYFMFDREGTPVAGAMPIGPETAGASDGWTTYLAVDDARASAERAAAAGATVLAPPYDVADLGSTALLTDPSGATVGIWQAATFAGFGATGPAAPPNAPAYFELHTREFDTAVTFYRDVLGWDARERTEVPGLSYATLGPGEASAGIMGAADYLEADEAPAWQIYFAVTDVDATAARAVDLGASVRRPALDTPFGRTASLADPNGARFTVMGPNTAG